MQQTEARRWLVKGKVHGVGFRYFVGQKADELGLEGWVRNLDDGRVEVYAIGPAERLSDLAGALHLGPRTAEVRHVEEMEEIVHQLTGFSIR